MIGPLLLPPRKCFASVIVAGGFFFKLLKTLWNLELIFKRSFFKNKLNFKYWEKWIDTNLLKYRVQSCSNMQKFNVTRIILHITVHNGTNASMHLMFSSHTIDGNIDVLPQNNLLVRWSSCSTLGFFSVGDWCWPILGPHNRRRIHSFWGEGRLR